MIDSIDFGKGTCVFIQGTIRCTDIVINCSNGIF